MQATQPGCVVKQASESEFNYVKGYSAPLAAIQLPWPLLDLKRSQSYLPQTPSLRTTMLFIFFHFLVLLATGAMALSPRDAIHIDDIDRYDSFLEQLDLDVFLDMHMEKSMINIDVFRHPTNIRIRSEQFAPSAMAHEYFDQEEKMANEIFGVNPNDNGDLIGKTSCRMAEGSQTVFNSAAQLPIAVGTMDVHTALLYDRAVFGRNVVDEGQRQKALLSDPSSA
ncbi:hypothetical protein CCM_07916 [Cordyceps militaris CM01]|uniref:Uncharacterized protein n=1 Tax=Cordyceps militaris (strain CM01) TaxID=983644 RepID=G3JP54_CORMM|nr:uncharacterized protein CCM_07916 [Cordyceps militaris CM01]EGX89664.1 hypothetical protein CCM_07916 [Cordyceps militaris CM01]